MGRAYPTRTGTPFPRGEGPLRPDAPGAPIRRGGFRARRGRGVGSVLPRRAFLSHCLRALSTLALLPLVETPTAAAQGPLAEPIRVRVGELLQATRADFAAGLAEGVALPREGGSGGLIGTQAGGTFTSAVLELGFPVSHLGLHWLGDGAIRFELRSSRDGARWSRWQRAWLEASPDETPRGEWFGALVGARAAGVVQYQATFPVSPVGVELQRVAITYFDAQPRTQVGGGGVRASPLSGLADFRAQIVPREVWGADESLRFREDGSEVWPRAYVPAKKAVVHHTATANGSADVAADVRAIYTYHAQTLGWGDIGYNLLVDHSGQVYEGRRGRDWDPEGELDREVASRDVVAGHATGFNYGTSGIALLGNFQEEELPALMRERLEEALAFECWRHGIDPLGESDFLLSNDLWRDDLPDLPGHRDCTPTECPGENVYGQLGAIRRAVAQRLALADRPRPGPVRLEQGRDPWPGRLSFSWSGLPGAEYSLSLEGWRRVPNSDAIVELAGYAPETSLPVWSSWSDAMDASFAVPPDEHGHYTLNLRTRTAPGREGFVWSRLTALVEPQVTVDNADPGLIRAEGEWERTTVPRRFYGRDYAYAQPGTGTSVFRWTLTAPSTGRYAVQACGPALSHLAKTAPFSLRIASRLVGEIAVDQTAGSGGWQTLAELDLESGQALEVALSNATAEVVVADAVRLLLV